MKECIEAHTWEGNGCYEVIAISDMKNDVNSQEVKRDVARKFLSIMNKFLPSDSELDKVKLKYHGVLPHYPMSEDEKEENKRQQIIRITAEMKKLNIPCWNM